ncbi:MAG: hypothetical protein LUD15_08450 [Bacteroides sp.]|nr:hypothetical protein [Bacteroides sp.]
MDNQNTKIILFKSRSVSGRLHAAFKFINDNFRVLLKLGSYIVVPVSVVATLYMFYYNTYVNQVLEGGLSKSALVVYFILSLCMLMAVLAGGSLFYGLLIHLIEYSQEKEFTLLLSWRDIKAPVFKKSLKLLGVFALITLLFIFYLGITIALVFVSPYTLIITLPLFFALLIPALLSPYIAVIGEKGILATLVETYRRGFRYWGSTFAVHFAMTMVGIIIQVVALLPFYIVILIYGLYLHSVQVGDMAQLPFYFLILYFVFALFGTFVGYSATALSITGNAFQYGSITALRHEIEKFEEESVMV